MFIDLHCVCYFNGICFISQELFQVGGTDFTAGIAAMNHVLTQLSKVSDLFRIVSHAGRILDTRSSSACTYLYEGDVCYHMFHISNYPLIIPESLQKLFCYTLYM